MMLRKRTRSSQKDQNMGHLKAESSDIISESFIQSNVLVQKHNSNSFFHVPGLFVGLSPKISDSDSVRSPTSPLDFRAFSNLGSPLRSPRTPHEGHQKRWDFNKVGLSIIDSLNNNDDTKQSGKVLRPSDSKNIHRFGPQMRIRSPNFGTHLDSFESPNSLPKNYAISHGTHIKPSNLQKGSSNALFGIEKALENPEQFGKILSCSLDSGSFRSHLTNLNAKSNLEFFCSEKGRKSVNSPSPFLGGNTTFANISENCIFGSLSASEIKLSEDYTCVRTNGPNPKTTHIFGDCVLECHENDLTDFSEKEVKKIEIPSAEETMCSEVLSPFPSNQFLSFCYSCKKNLEGEDIYMYRGEKAFCSWTCRSEEILIEEAMEKKTNKDSPQNSSMSNNCEELFESCMFIAS